MDCSQQLIVECLSWVLAGTLENLPLRHTKEQQAVRRGAGRVTGWEEVLMSQATGSQFSQHPQLLPCSQPLAPSGCDRGSAGPEPAESNLGAAPVSAELDHVLSWDQ